MPATGVPKLDHAQVLRYEEILTIVRAAVAEGVFRVRITGGEPLVRRDLAGFVSSLAEISEISDLALTTNGILLEQFAQSLVNAGLKRVNISLDSLKPDRFRAMTRGGDINAVLRGIDAAIAAGLTPVKINVVLMPGENEDEVFDFSELVVRKAVHVRFIERMPFSGAFHDEKTPAVDEGISETPATMFVSQENLMRRLSERFTLVADPESAAGGPAQMYALSESPGRIGFISSRTNPFCRRCNRLRLTASGILLPCLDSERGAGVRGLSEVEVRAVIQHLAEEKRAAGKGCAEFRHSACRSLSDIGG